MRVETRVVVFTLGLALAGDGMGAPVQPEVQLNQEKDVLSLMNQTNQLEMEIGKLAKKKGRADEVRAFGDRVERDHQFANREVKKVARKLNVELSSLPLTQQQRRILSRLRTLSGRAFDRYFTMAMDRAHHQTVSLLTLAAQRLPRSDLTRLIDRFVPILNQHGEVATQLDEEIRS